jgi:hypothetical protein
MERSSIKGEYHTKDQAKIFLLKSNMERNWRQLAHIQGKKEMALNYRQ